VVGVTSGAQVEPYQIPQRGRRVAWRFSEQRWRNYEQAGEYDIWTFIHCHCALLVHYLFLATPGCVALTDETLYSVGCCLLIVRLLNVVFQQRIAGDSEHGNVD